MSNRPEKDNEIATTKKGGNVISALLKVVGVVMILLVIISSLPLGIPRLFKIQTYDVVSGSMDPEIPVGSLIYVKETPPEEIVENDIILFVTGNSQVVHRVLENKRDERVFRTKGDANTNEDLNETMYNMVVGKVVFHMPYVGNLLMLYTSKQGKVAVLIFAVVGAFFSLLADRIGHKK